MGTEFEFRRVAMRPGKPFAFGPRTSLSGSASFVAMMQASDLWNGGDLAAMQHCA